MLTGEIRNQVDKIWNAFWSGGVSNPLSVIEQITYLLFIKRLDELQVVDRPPDNRDKIYFGGWVTLEDAEGKEQRWRIVGPDEFDLAAGKLSMDSPLARALIGKDLDAEVMVKSPSGEQVYYVVDIHYD